MKRAARLLCCLSALLGLLAWVKSPPGLLGGVLWLPRLWAQAWAPFAAILGGVGAVLGLRARDPRAVSAGLLGAAASAAYTARAQLHSVAILPGLLAPTGSSASLQGW